MEKDYLFEVYQIGYHILPEYDFHEQIATHMRAFILKREFLEDRTFSRKELRSRLRLSETEFDDVMYNAGRFMCPADLVHAFARLKVSFH